MTNSSTQITPDTSPLDAQTLNESLDLIRDILRDSGTRLLNLITDMSLSMLSGAERGEPRRARSSRALSDDGEGGNSAAQSRRSRSRPRPRLLSADWRRELLFSSSDSDSDRSLEVNILRTRNSTFREDDVGSADRLAASVATAGPPLPTDRMVFELTNDFREENAGADTSGVNVSLSNGRFRVRTQGSDEEPAAGPSSSAAPSTSEPDLERPSTSRDEFWNGGDTVPSDEAYRRVRSGVSALQKHAVQLANMWLRGNRTTMRELRTMWENLRRRIISLHRESGRQDTPGYYTRSLLERCMMLTDMSNPIMRSPGSNSRPSQREAGVERNGASNELAPGNTSSCNQIDRELESAEDTVRNIPLPPLSRPQSRTSSNIRSSSSMRRRIQSSFRWRLEDELRRRLRLPHGNRLAPRYSNRSCRDLTRAIEISATRHEIRMRAMQVLSVMFNMMMMCLEERGLSQLIIIMLRTLKKALALTCFMLMTNRNNGRNGNSQAPANQNVESMDVVRIQNVEHTGPVNVDGPDESVAAATAPQNERVEAKVPKVPNNNTNESIDIVNPSTSQSESTEKISSVQENSSVTSSSSISQTWSNRLAVQIAAANRNNSATARNRRDLYLESRRLKALHRTNPLAHPLMKRRAMPPLSTYKIPSLRSLPNRSNATRFMAPRIASQSSEPVAGPSNAPPSSEPYQNWNEFVMTGFDRRFNFIRMAHVRLRNAVRNRRLQSIRLYTPSSVHEIFSVHPNSVENQNENGSIPQISPEEANRRPFAFYRPEFYTTRNESGDYVVRVQNMMNDVAPAVQSNDQPTNESGQESPSQRMPRRIHEYLQPIILAQVKYKYYFI